MNKLLGQAMIRATNMALFFTSGKVILMAIVITYVLGGNTVTAEAVSP